MESLDPQSRLCLYHHENEPLESLARHADQILSRTTSLHNSPTDMVVSNQQLINESVEAKLGSIEQSIAKLNQTANNSHIERNAAASNQRGSYSERTPSRFVPPQRRVIQFSSGAQNDLCRYHTRYGERAFRCENPYCSLHHLVASQAQHRITTSHQQTKKRFTCLHNIGGWGQDINGKSLLFFVKDHWSNIQFLVDSEAAFSLFPLSGLHCVHDGTPLQPCTTNAILSAIGGGKLSIVGFLFLSLDLGFSKLFSFNFHVADQVNYGILGADFLSHHRLNVSIALQRLSETVEIDRCIPDEPYSEPNAYKISSDSESNCNLLNDKQQEFPEVFDCNKRKHFVKHSVIATVETSTEIPIHSASRRLSPEQYKALKFELTRLLDQGILERSQSPWTSPIVMVKKKTGDWRLFADFTNLNKVLDMQK